jgi:RNA polymerase sigma-70 factor (ECF subfamily)
MADAPEHLALDEDEQALLAGLRAGAEGAFETLVRTTSARLLAVARRIVGSEEDARDVLQEAYTSAFKALPRFEGQAKLSTWLHRIVVNTALMRLRTRKRKPEEPIEPLLPAFKDDGHQTQAAAEWADGADVALERAETRSFVRAQIDRLPDTYRTVLLLRDIEELSTSEVAVMLSTPPKTREDSTPPCQAGAAPCSTHSAARASRERGGGPMNCRECLRVHPALSGWRTAARRTVVLRAAHVAMPAVPPLSVAVQGHGGRRQGGLRGDEHGAGRRARGTHSRDPRKPQGLTR